MPKLPSGTSLRIVTAAPCLQQYCITVVLRTASPGYSYLLSFAIAVLVPTTAAPGNSSGDDH